MVDGEGPAGVPVLTWADCLPYFRQNAGVRMTSTV
jgi:hypothetical protein